MFLFLFQHLTSVTQAKWVIRGKYAEKYLSRVCSLVGHDALSPFWAREVGLETSKAPQHLPSLGPPTLVLSQYTSITLPFQTVFNGGWSSMSLYNEKGLLLCLAHGTGDILLRRGVENL